MAPRILVPQYRTFAGKSEAIKAVEAYGAVLAVGQQVAGYRAPYVGPLFQEARRDAGPAARRSRRRCRRPMPRSRRRATAVGALNDGAAIVDGLDKAAAKLADVRAASDRALGAAHERARSGGGQGLPARHCRGDRDDRAAAEPP